jgi:hypothetical protein
MFQSGNASNNFATKPTSRSVPGKIAFSSSITKSLPSRRHLTLDLTPNREGSNPPGVAAVMHFNCPAEIDNVRAYEMYWNGGSRVSAEANYLEKVSSA